MTLPRFDPIATAAALVLLLAIVLSPGDATIGVALGACCLGVVPRPELAEGERQ